MSALSRLPREEQPARRTVLAAIATGVGQFSLIFGRCAAPGTSVHSVGWVCAVLASEPSRTDRRNC